jgi:hypothetical protein
MGSLAGGEQSATQPPVLLQLPKSPPDPDEALEPEELELVVVAELEDPVIAPELLAEPPAPPVLPELLVEPPVPPVVPDPPLPVAVVPPVPLPGLVPVLAQEAKRGTRAARAAWGRFMAAGSRKSEARGEEREPREIGAGVLRSGGSYLQLPRSWARTATKTSSRTSRRRA